MPAVADKLSHIIWRRSKVTAVHKANIMKKADGLFLECCREVGARDAVAKHLNSTAAELCSQSHHAASEDSLVETAVTQVIIRMERVLL
jgi:isocitrate dehydrogenase